MVRSDGRYPDRRDDRVRDRGSDRVGSRGASGRGALAAAPADNQPQARVRGGQNPHAAGPDHPPARPVLAGLPRCVGQGEPAWPPFVDSVSTIPCMVPPSV